MFELLDSAATTRATRVTGSIGVGQVLIGFVVLLCGCGLAYMLQGLGLNFSELRTQTALTLLGAIMNADWVS